MLLGRARQRRRKTREFALTGIFRCAECGFGVTAKEVKNRYGSRYTYYRCAKRRLDYRCHLCTATLRPPAHPHLLQAEVEGPTGSL